MHQALPGIIDELKADIANENTVYNNDSSRIDQLAAERAAITQRNSDDSKMVNDMITNQTNELLIDQQYIYHFEDEAAAVRLFGSGFSLIVLKLTSCWLQSMIRCFIYGPSILMKGLKKLSKEEKRDAHHWYRLLKITKSQVQNHAIHYKLSAIFANSVLLKTLIFITRTDRGPYRGHKGPLAGPASAAGLPARTHLQMNKRTEWASY